MLLQLRTLLSLLLNRNGLALRLNRFCDLADTSRAWFCLSMQDQTRSRELFP